MALHWLKNRCDAFFKVPRIRDQNNCKALISAVLITGGKNSDLNTWETAVSPVSWGLLHTAPVELLYWFTLDVGIHEDASWTPDYLIGTHVMGCVFSRIKGTSTLIKSDLSQESQVFSTVDLYILSRRGP